MEFVSILAEVPFWRNTLKIEIMDSDSESDSTDNIYEVERILDAKRKVSLTVSDVRYVKFSWKHIVQ